MYLLNTNHCSRIIQGHPSVIRKLVELRDTPVSTCVTVCGELIFMAEKSGNRKENLNLVRRFLRDILIHFWFFCRRRTQTYTDRNPKAEYGVYAKNMP